MASSSIPFSNDVIASANSKQFSEYESEAGAPIRSARPRPGSNVCADLERDSDPCRYRCATTTHLRDSAVQYTVFLHLTRTTCKDCSSTAAEDTFKANRYVHDSRKRIVTYQFFAFCGRSLSARTSASGTYGYRSVSKPDT